MTAGYLSARTPTRTLGRTPFEVWHGKKPDLSHLREIGSRAFALILKHNPKIYERSFECILVGYSPHSKAYSLYHPSTHRLFESFHIKFIERKDEVSHPLYPGRVVDLPVTDDPVNTTLPMSLPTLSSSASSPKHTSVQDEEEFVTSTSNPVWGGPPHKLEVPVPLLRNPANVVPVPTDNIAPTDDIVPAADIVPVPAADTDIIPRRSARPLVPSTKAAKNLHLHAL